MGQIKAAPKLKGLLLSSQLSRDVVLKALLGHELSDDREREEARKLVDRLQARL